jgi:hypothetical protein
VKFFYWLLFSDRLNTRNMLKRRHFNIGTDFSCPLCDSPPEGTLEHLFFHCSFSTSCWQELGWAWQPRDRLELVERAKTLNSSPMFMEIFMIATWNIRKE